MKKSIIKKNIQGFLSSIRKMYLENRKLFLEVILSTGLISYLTYRQTKISEQQLKISQQQQKILEYQHSIEVYEHTPKFRFSLYYEKKDSLGGCASESIIIENKGYSIKDFSIEVYSFIEIKSDSLSKIIPIELYFSVGVIGSEDKGNLAEYTHTYNCKTIDELQEEMLKHVNTYGWQVKRFHLVQIIYKDYAGEDKIVFLCNKEDKLDLEIPNSMAKSLLNIYKTAKKLSIYNVNYDNVMKIIAKR